MNNWTAKRKVRARIITVDPATRKIEAALKEAAAVQVTLWEIPSNFRWPRVGEFWTLYREEGYWHLGHRLEGNKEPDADFRIEDMAEGDLKLGATTIFTDEGNQLPTYIPADATTGTILIKTPDGWVPITSASATTITGVNDEGSDPHWTRADHDHAIAFEPWHEVGSVSNPPFENSWVNYDSAVETAAFCKDVNGIVRLKGTVKNGSGLLTIFTLPVGYRPAKGLIFPAISNNAIGRIDITSGGAIIPGIGSTAFYTLDQVSFRV